MRPTLKERALIGDSIIDLVCREYIVANRYNAHILGLMVSNKRLTMVGLKLGMFRDKMPRTPHAGGTYIESYVYFLYMISFAEAKEWIIEHIVKPVIKDYGNKYKMH